MRNNNKSNTTVKIIALGLVILMVSSGSLYFLNADDDSSTELINNSTLGKYLDNAGWMLFVQQGCPACTVQKDTIGNEIAGLKVIDCSASPEETQLCLDNNITRIPTWVNSISNESSIGVLNITQLTEMTK